MIKRFKKLIHFILCFSLIFNVLQVNAFAEISNDLNNEFLNVNGTITGNVPTLSEDYRAWAQADPRWGNIRLGNSGETMAAVGCTLTALTKLIIQANLRNANDFNPGTLINLMNAKNGFTSSGLLYWGSVSNCVPGFVNYGEIKPTGTYNSSEYTNTFINWIKQGYHLCVQVKGYSHWVAIDSVKTLATGQVYIMDSLKTGINADITLASRYPTFNRVQAYKGGSITQPSTEKITVSFSANGGNGSASSQTVGYNEDSVILPNEDTFTRNGYKFIGYSLYREADKTYCTPTVGWQTQDSITKNGLKKIIYPPNAQYKIDSSWTKSPSSQNKFTFVAEWSQKIDFDLQGGKIDGFIDSYTADGVNTDRGYGELIVYDIDNKIVNTNIHGEELLVSPEGYIVEKKPYGDGRQLTVPSGGMVVSGHLHWEGDNKVGAILFTSKVGAGQFLAYDYATKKVSAYSNYSAYLYDNTYLTGNDIYGALPIPVKDGYYFDGWYTQANGGEKVSYADTYKTAKLYAHWTKEPTLVASTIYEGHTYQVFDNNLSWEEAQTYCESIGGNLVSITSPEENEVVRKLISQGKKGYYNLGLVSKDTLNNWSWVTGESFDYNNWDTEHLEGKNDYYGFIISIDNPPNKDSGEWIDSNAYNDTNGGFYHQSNRGFVCEIGDVVKPITGIQLSKTKLTIEKKHSQNNVVETLNAVVLPENTTESKEVNWYSSNPNVATVEIVNDTCIVNAIGVGKTTITASTSNGKTATCEVEVVEGHEYGTNYLNNEEQHWNQCACGHILPKESHSFEKVKLPATCKEYAKTVYTCSTCGYIKEEYDDYTEWSTEKPTNVDEKDIETKVQYRYSDYETLVSKEPTMNGYELVSSKWNKVGSKSITYVKSWPSGFKTSSSLYNQYNKSSVKASENAISKVEINSDNVTGYIYYHWCRGEYAHGPINRKSDNVQTSECDTFHAFYSTTKPNTLTSASDNDGSYSYSNASCCTDTYWYYPIAVNTQNSTNYEKEFTYARWTEMSAWSDNPVQETSSRKVESRTLYRCLTKELKEHTYGEWIVVKEATEDSMGLKKQVCKVCGNEVSEEIAKIPHTHLIEKISGKDATHNSEGIREHYHCTKCNKLYSDVNGSKEISKTDTIIEMIPHSFGNFKKDSINHWKECSCGEVSDKYIHDFGEWVNNEADRTRSCIICGYEEKQVLLDAKIKVLNATAIKGHQVDVNVQVEGNPGITSMQLAVGYDSTKLKLVKVTDGELLGSAIHTDNYTLNPYYLSWANDLATENITNNGIIVTLTFEVLDDAELGNTEITIGYDYENYDIVNADTQPIKFATINGTVDITDVMVGDVNSDGKINTLDRMILTRYLAKWTGYGEDSIVKAAADVNQDGKINTLDRMILIRYLAKWTGYVELPYK